MKLCLFIELRPCPLARAGGVRSRYFFQAGGKGHRLEVLEIGPEGLRLLVPRRTLVVAFVAALAIAAFLGLQPVISAIYYAWRPVDSSMAWWISVIWWLIVPIFLFFLGPYLLGRLAARALVWITVTWPRKVVRLEFRAIETHPLTQWIRASAEGEETWIQVAGFRRKVLGALRLAGRGADPAG